MMLGWLFYLFRKYGDDIADAYHKDYGRLEVEVDMSGVFYGYTGGYDNLVIFRFANLKNAIELFSKEVGRLNDGR